jgi:hypothetical protein
MLSHEYILSYWLKCVVIQQDIYFLTLNDIILKKKGGKDMAVKAYMLGKKLVIKESGGKFFPSGAVAWTDNPAARPDAVMTRNTAFTGAAKACTGRSKSKHGTVWGKSDYNKCIGDHLRTGARKLRKVA